MALNRVADDRFPDTLAEVLTQKGQYGTMYWDGIVWPPRAQEPREQELLQLRLRSINPAIRDAHALAWICEHYYDRTGVRLAQRYLFRFTPPEKGQIRSIQRRSRNWSEERLDETEGKTGGQK